MAEDRFANIFTSNVVLSAANTITFTELTFGITLRDRIAIVIDELYFRMSSGVWALMTTAADFISFGITISDSVTNLLDWQDRRNVYSASILRADFGTAAAAELIYEPIKASFSPPIIVLPNRLFLGANSTGLGSAFTVNLRMHYRTVSITQDQQLIEVLETLQASS